jgi:hypothetical protein
MREAISGNNPLRKKDPLFLFISQLHPDSTNLTKKTGPTYEKLIRIHNTLERGVNAMQFSSKLSISGKGLVSLQMELGAIDNMRVDGKFVDESGGCPEGQAVMHFLLHKVMFSVPLALLWNK